MDDLSYRPTAYFYRKIAREAPPLEVRAEMLRLTREHEQLREWVRNLGLIPPRFDAPRGWVKDVRDRPVTDFQQYLSERW